MAVRVAQGGDNVQGLSSDARSRLANTRRELQSVVALDAPAALVDQLPKMRRENRATVCIPVIAFGDQEVETLQRTLNELSRQTMPTDDFEIVLFLNRPQGEISDQTIEVARQAQQRMPNLHLMEAEIPRDERLAIGFIRGLLHAVVSERARLAQVTGLVHVVTDADMVSIHPMLVERHLERLAFTGADACIGQLDWDDPQLPTWKIPALIVGSSMMRLMPRHANKWIIEQAALGESVDLTHLWEAVLARNFGRGVLANVAIRDEAYRRVGGYPPWVHGEDYGIMQRIWLTAWERGNSRALCFGWAEHGIVAASSSRRAIFALHDRRIPVVCQWDHSGVLALSPVRNGRLPDMSAFRSIDITLLVQQINASFEAFPLHAPLLERAVPETLGQMGMAPTDYEMRFLPHTGEPVCVAKINLRSPQGLLDWVSSQQVLPRVQQPCAALGA